jgi:hypothetical protein
VNAELKLVRPIDDARIKGGFAAWERRRTWSKTDTARWLNARSPAVLAWLRRKPGDWPKQWNHTLGYWLRDSSTRVFNRAHKRLLAGGDDATREQMDVGTILK